MDYKRSGAGDEACAKLTGEPQEETLPNYIGEPHRFVKLY